ncbi:MAG: M20 metallopeptidase family protein [Ferrimicrobium sp.]|jgi:amidohydrolase|uniref:M20 family metallopeptidase n=1 Tax=Ferrimicrobium acidiphilum TaxID=121039 RepID=A0ABV3XZT1_9ACTN|nr:M20 family metallopeptidase [Ferrimicrobium sp.]
MINADHFRDSARADGELARRLRTRSAELVPQLIEWRRYLHTIPELAFEEYETAAFIVARLSEMGGFVIREQVGGTGVVADLQVGQAPKILLRADMDALPVTEVNEENWASRNLGLMHACGHDAHMAMLLGAARLLSELVNEGYDDLNVRLLFQPAEEAAGPDGVSGALRTIEDGALADVDASLAMHVEPAHELGVVRLGSGYVMASVDTFTGVIRGVGGHAARPEETVDPFWLLTPVLSAIQGIVGRRISPLESAVVSLCHVMGGDIGNVIPSDVMLEGTMRSFRPEVRERLYQELEAAFDLARDLGGEVDLDIRAESPPLYNDEGVRAKLLTAIASLELGDQILDGPYGLMGEDFAEFAARVPSAMVMLGCAPEVGAASLHSPTFGIDERVLERGAALLAFGSATVGRL